MELQKLLSPARRAIDDFMPAKNNTNLLQTASFKASSDVRNVLSALYHPERNNLLNKDAKK